MNDKTSKNLRAGKLVGMRRTDAIAIDQPCELKYHCPVCVYRQMSPDGTMYDERLHWSEYNGFIWCAVCDFDYPSALCLPDDPRRAAEIFLDTVAHAVERALQRQ